MSRAEIKPAAFTPCARSAEHGFTFSARSAEHGFTLIEMLVALAVFSLAALALLRLEGATVTTTARLQDHLIGEIVARNVAITAVTDPLSPALGRSGGTETNAGRSWSWTRTVTDLGETRRIDVAVTAPDGRPAGSIAMFRGTS